MKKFTTLLSFVCCFAVQGFGQVNAPAGSNYLSRSGAVAGVNQQPARSIIYSTGTGIQAPEVQRFGGSPVSAVAFSDDFSMPSDTIGLQARGYLTYWRGTGPLGTVACWFQGNVNNWPDYNNGSSEYVSSNYQSVTATNDIDNWLVLPALDVATGDVISFYSRSPLNSTYPDSIRVMYSAVGDSVPEDLSWVELGRFKVNTAGSWMQETFIAPAAGTMARFAIRYAVVGGGPTGLNSDLIGIDQLDVFTPQAVDAQAIDINRLNDEYTMIPLTQAASSMFTATVKNNGLNALSGATALIEVYDTVTTTVAFSETVNVPTLNPGATTTVNTTNSFTPTLTGIYKPRVTVMAAGDGNSANDVIASSTTAYTDSVFARDDNQTSGSLGIGAGPAMGIVGQNFTLTSAVDVTSVSFWLTDGMDPNPAGSDVFATIHSQIPGQGPNNTALATTTTLSVMPGTIATGGQWFTLPIQTPVQLSPGTYYVGMHEVDSLLTLGTTANIVTAATVWVTWATIPTPPAVNGWASADDFGFSVTYNLRLNVNIPSGIPTVDGPASLVSVYPSPASSQVYINLNESLRNSNIEIYNAMGQLANSIRNADLFNTVDVSKLAKGVYSVKVINGEQSITRRFTVAN